MNRQKSLALADDKPRRWGEMGGGSYIPDCEEDGVTGAAKGSHPEIMQAQCFIP